MIYLNVTCDVIEFLNQDREYLEGEAELFCDADEYTDPEPHSRRITIDLMCPCFSCVLQRAARRMGKN